MKLLLDVGNTRIKWALHDMVQIVAAGAVPHDEISSLPGEIAGSGMTPDSAYLACVGQPDLCQQLATALPSQWPLTVRQLHSASHCCGVVNGYHDPAQLGVDRWAVIVGAHAQFDGALCVVDCGTAVTIDALQADGRHLGGYIVPGIAMQRSLLRQGTAAVNPGEVAGYVPGWGQDTGSCLRHGAAEAIAGLIERSTRQLAQECNERVTTVVTGGDATGILPLLTNQAHYAEHLVLQGMACMVRELEG